MQEWSEPLKLDTLGREYLAGLDSPNHICPIIGVQSNYSPILCLWVGIFPPRRRTSLVTMTAWEPSATDPRNVLATATCRT